MDHRGRGGLVPEGAARHEPAKVYQVPDKGKYRNALYFIVLYDIHIVLYCTVLYDIHIVLYCIV